MSNWKVNISHLRENGGDLQDISSQILKMSGELDVAGNLSGFSFADKIRVSSRLNQVKNTLAHQSEQTTAISRKLEEIAGAYESTEQKLVEGMPKVTVTKPGSGQNGDGSGGSFSSGGGDGGGGGGRGDKDDKDDNILDIIKAYLTAREKGEGDDDAGFTKDVISYFEDLFDFFSGDMKGYSGFADWCDLGKSSSGLWKAMVDFFKNRDPGDYIDEKFGKAAMGVGVIGSLFGLIGGVTEALGANGESAGQVISKWLDAAKDGTDLGKTIYDIFDKHEGVYTPAGIYTVIVGSALSVLSQGSRSVDEYLKDGKWDIMDFAGTGVDVSIAGLESLLSGLTFGVISDDTFGTSVDEISDNLKNKAEEGGKKAGEYIVNHPDMLKEYQEGNVFDKVRLTAVACLKSWW
ncbi:MAG: hypothetical protein Q4F29_12945 [Lachnospiraceae bacterium]|nr:hypothetical protein [Lachnospiraceae bacterium]